MSVLTTTPEKLAEIPLLKGLPQHILMELAATCSIKELEAGETLFHQGDPAASFYRIEEGQVHAERHYENGEHLVLATFSPYDVVGELSMLAQEPRMVSITAASDCEFTVFDSGAFFGLMDKYAEMSKQVMLYVGRRLHQIYVNVHEYALGSPEARLASLLLMLAGDIAGIATTQYHRHQMARGIGVDHMWLKNTILEWHDKGFIERDGTTIVVKNVEMLRTIVDKI